MGACVTTITKEIQDTRQKTSIINIKTHDSSDGEYLINEWHHDQGRRSPFATHSSAETVYDTLTDNISSEERKRTESDNNEDYKKMKVSSYHCCWTIGCNRNGSQGNGTKRTLTQLTKLTSLPKHVTINAIVTGNCGSTYLLINDRTKLYVWGHNVYHQLSMDNQVIGSILRVWNGYKSLSRYLCDLLISFIEDIDALREPLKPSLVFNEKIKWISLGICSFHKFLMLQSGALYGMGKNGWNQLGLGVTQSKESAHSHHCIQIEYFAVRQIHVKQIACALNFTIFLDQNGAMYSAGKATHGGLGLGRHISCTEGIHPMANPKHCVLCIACGEYHTLAITQRHEVLSWGRNHFGQLGHGNTKDVYQPQIIKYLSDRNIEIEKISCGAYHNVLLDSDERVHCFGRNFSFECGTGNNGYNVTEPQINHTLRHVNVVDVKCGFAHNVVKTESDEFWLWGTNEFNQCLVCRSGQHFVKIPTKYKTTIDGISDWLDYKIMDIYPGWKETRVVTATIRRASTLPEYA